MKILCIGNSFSQDTTRLLAKTALGLGEEQIKVVNLYLGGCSVRMHWLHARLDRPAYRYEEDRGRHLLMTPNYRISQALAADSWDWVCIQQGSRDGSFYSREESYTELPKLVEYIRRRVPAHTRIGFNMTWVGEPENNRPEMIFYGRQQQRLFGAISALTRDLLAPMEGIDRICPIGTAIQNARTAVSEPLTRDGYHLSLTLGRYIAALTFWKALTGGDLRGAAWAPEGVDEAGKKLAILAAETANADPFLITKLS